MSPLHLLLLSYVPTSFSAALPRDATPPSADSDSTVPPAALFFTLLSLAALLTTSQPTGHTPYFPLYVTPILRSLRSSPFFCLLDATYTLLHFPILLLTYPPQTAARILLYTKLTPDTTIRLFQRSTDPAATTASSALESAARDTRFRILVALPALLQCAKLFGMRGVPWFRTAGVVYVLSWTVNEVLYLLATGAFTRSSKREEWWEDIMNMEPHKVVRRWWKLRVLLITLSWVAFLLPGVYFSTYPLGWFFSGEAEDRWWLKAGQPLMEACARYGNFLIGVLGGENRIFLLPGGIIISVIPALISEKLKNADEPKWVMAYYVCKTLHLLNSVCFMPLVPWLILIIMFVLLELILVISVMFGVPVLTYFGFVVLPGALAYGGWRRCPRHVTDRPGEEIHWMMLLFLDERVYVVHQIVWATLLCYWVYQREGTGRSDWTELLG